MTETQLHPTTINGVGADRWTGTGTSTLPDCHAAGVEAAGAATLAPDTALYLVFAGHRRDHEAVLAGVASVAPNGATIVGCTTSGEIGGGGPVDGGVVVMAIGGPGISVATRCSEVIGGDLRTAGEDVAAAVWDADERGHTVLLLLSDGLAGDQREVVRGAYAALGAGIPLVGGGAGDGLEMRATKIFHADRTGTRVASGQVVGIAISSVAPIGIGVAHGWRPVGEPVLITHAVGNLIHTIDDEPALDRYLQLHGAAPDLGDDPDAFVRFAATHPLGVSRRNREDVCSVHSADPETRSLVTFSPVTQGVVAYFMEGSAETVLEATRAACEAALQSLDGPPVGVLAFDCAARREVIGSDRAPAMVQEMEQIMGVPVAGFYTYGEFARFAGSSGFHTGTLVMLAIG